MTEAAIHGIDLWYEEHEFYDYDQLHCDDDATWSTCDHFKQVVAARTRYVGCGAHECDSIDIDGVQHSNALNVVCNYYPSFVPQSAPYRSDGDVCAHCDVDRVCARDLQMQNGDFFALCSGCMSPSFVYCEDSSALCSEFASDCDDSATLQKLCRTTCATCESNHIDGHNATKCCSNGIDEILNCPIADIDGAIVTTTSMADDSQSNVEDEEDPDPTQSEATTETTRFDILSANQSFNDSAEWNVTLDFDIDEEEWNVTAFVSTFNATNEARITIACAHSVWFAVLFGFYLQ